MLSNRWSILALLFAVRTGMGLQYEIVPALSPLFMSDFSLNVADIGLLIGIYHAPGAILAFPGGAIAARLGDKRVVLIGLALMIFGELMMAFTDTWSMQIAGRFLAGAGGILLNVVMTKMVADWFAGKEMATAMAIFGNSAIIGIALALVTLPFVAVAGGGHIFASYVIVAYLAVSLFAMAFLYRAPLQGGSIAPRQSFWPERRALWAVLAAGLIYGLYNVGLTTIFGFGPLMLTERGWTIAAASSTTSVVLWVIAFSVPAGGFLADRTRHSPMLLVGGLVGFAVALALSSRVDAMLPAFILLGIMSGIPCGAIMSLPTQVLTLQTRSIGMGIFFTVYYSLQVSGPWFIGHVAKVAGSSQVAFDVGAVLLCTGGLIWFVFRQLANSPIDEKEVKVTS